ncbi:PhoH family protein [Natronogracilivirga saccharolytica]|uniref:PhoH-like protein n=1 Tax=Natronogracilivirga saccharolytica TaxID=2812953 RepID=A0A8J7RPM5_9BACT|nr:PhoH family protein [Natronogracilivirga saccharolytica]
MDSVDPVVVLGLQDRILKQIDEAYTESKLTVRGNEIKVTGPPEQFEGIEAIIKELIRLARRNGAVTENDVSTLLSLQKSDRMLRQVTISPDETLLYTTTGTPISARTANQKVIVKASNENDIVFAIGPAGTGKTYTSVALAVRALKERQVKKIILVRPAVEAGESLGFLPGNLKDKIDPYLRPLYDSLEEMLDFDKLEMNINKNIIEIAPLAYMRGRTLNNAFVILDEAQNATQMQMKMFLTRLGVNSKAIITGDLTQTDLPKNQHSGLMTIQHILEKIKGISFVYLDQNDVVRHKLIRDIIEAYERYEDKK